MEKKCKTAKWLSEEGSQIAVKRRKVKSKGEKERYTHLNAKFQRIARRGKKDFFSGPHSVRPLHHDMPVLGGLTWNGLVSLN